MKRVNYDEVADIYDRRYEQSRPAGIAEYLQELAHKVTARRVLEAGCGTGQWLTLMHDHEIRCGLDYSVGMLTRARQRDGELALVRGTAAQLPFPKNSFDIVFCVHALHHFEDPAIFIHEAHRIIGRGGALAIIGMDPQTERDRWYLYDYFPGTYEADLERYPSGERILGWMKAVGFVNCERRLAARIEHNFIGEEVLADPILHKNGTSQLSLLTEEAFEAGRAGMLEAIRLAERQGEEIIFSTQIALPAVIGFAADAAGDSS